MAGVLLETMSKKQIIIFTLTALLSLAIFFILGGTKGEFHIHPDGKYFSSFPETETGSPRTIDDFVTHTWAEFSSFFGTTGRVKVDE